MNGPPSTNGNPFEFTIGRQRQYVHTSLYNNLAKIPGVENVRWGESNAGIAEEIRADIAVDVFANGVIPCSEAHLTVNWWPQESGERDWFQIHYWDDTGFDCGWHRHDNDHVDGLTHYQERDDEDDEYDYSSISFDHENPIGILWDVVDDQLIQVILSRYAE